MLFLGRRAPVRLGLLDQQTCRREQVSSLSLACGLPGVLSIGRTPQKASGEREGECSLQSDAVSITEQSIEECVWSWEILAVK